MNKFDSSFWEAIDDLVNQSEIIIDRPKGSAHPKYPNFIYIGREGKGKATFYFRKN